MMGGTEDLDKQEESYLKGLWAGTTFLIVKGILHLHDSAGNERVAMSRHPRHTPDTKSNTQP
jgi:hypothetical protein